MRSRGWLAGRGSDNRLRCGRDSSLAWPSRSLDLGRHVEGACLLDCFIGFKTVLLFGAEIEVEMQEQPRRVVFGM